MPKAVSIEIPEATALKVIDDIMANYPEAGGGMSLVCVGWKYSQRTFKFVDAEEDKEYTLDQPKLLAGFALMFTDKWPKGLRRPPACKTYSDDGPWDNWLCDADAFYFDAFVQLCLLGEVIYG